MRTGTKRGIGAALFVLGALLLAGCGASAPSRTPTDVEILQGGTSTTAGSSAVASYVPTGRLIADSGLRPTKDGFGFANYGDENAVTNLTPAAVEELFGPAVCASGTRATCALIPSARAWMEEENDAMAAGHCFGMAAAALQFHASELHPAGFGGASAPQLALAGNAPLQRTIAQLNALQELPSQRRHALSGTPSFVLDKLIASLRAGGTPYVLGLFRSDGRGGHAVTPYAVEDRGDGRYAVLVYDNNVPGVTRAISFDRSANAWKFVAQSNPKDPSQLYTGTARASNLALFSAARATGLLPCPFCRAADAASRGAGRPMNEVALEGDPRNHAHLLITDPDGRRTGFVGRRFVNEIPGAEVTRRLNATQDWTAASEPVYQIPAGVSLTVTIDAATVRRPVTERLEVIGPGDRVELAGVALRRGERVKTRIAGDGSSVSLTTDPRHDETPLLRLGIEGHPTSWDFTLKATRLRGGSTLRLLLDRPRQQLDIDTRGVLAAGRYDVGLGEYDVRLDRLGSHGTATFRHDGLVIPRGTLARLRYGAFRADHRRLQLVEERAGTTVTVPVTGAGR